MKKRQCIFKSHHCRFKKNQGMNALRLVHKLLTCWDLHFLLCVLKLVVPFGKENNCFWHYLTDLIQAGHNYSADQVSIDCLNSSRNTTCGNMMANHKQIHYTDFSPILILCFTEVTSYLQLCKRRRRRKKKVTM